MLREGFRTQAHAAFTRLDLQDLAQRQGACVVCATHDASVTARATNVIAMRDGKVAPGTGGAQAPSAIA